MWSERIINKQKTCKKMKTFSEKTFNVTNSIKTGKAISNFYDIFLTPGNKHLGKKE